MGGVEDVDMSRNLSLKMKELERAMTHSAG